MSSPPVSDAPPTYRFPVRRLVIAALLVAISVGLTVAAAVGRDVVLAAIAATVFAAGAYAAFALVQVWRGAPGYTREEYYDITRSDDA